MATESYTWFKPDTNLRAAFGGAAIQNGGDSSEITPATLTLRYICQQLGLPTGATRFIGEVGVATDTFTYIRLPTTVYNAVSSKLTAAETGSAVTTIPTGWTKGSTFIQLQPDPLRWTWLIRGESIPAGTLTTSGDPRDVWLTQLINGIAGETITWDDAVNFRDGYSKNFRLLNYSVPSSSWGNTNAGGGQAVYPFREDLAYNQRTKTLAMNSAKCIWTPTLGTNDGAYDLTLTSAQLWSRMQTGILRTQADFPSLKIAPATTGKRTNDATLNGRLQGMNDLLRANWQSMGLAGLFDIEANVSQLNMVTGDMSNVTYSPDTVHWTTLLHGLVATAMRSTFVAIAR